MNSRIINCNNEQSAQAQANDPVKMPYIMFGDLQQKYTIRYPSMTSAAGRVPDAFGHVRAPAKFTGQASIEQIRKRGILNALFF